MSIPLVNFKNIEFDPKDLYKYIQVNIMINFQNERRKNPGLGKDQICRNIGVKPSSFDRLIQDLNLPHGPYRYDVTAKGKKQQSTNDNTKENTNHCTECNKIYKTPSSFKAHNTKFHKVKKDQKVKETSLLDNIGKGKLDNIVDQSPSFIKESNTIISNIQSGINSSLYNNPPLQNLSINLSTKLTDKLLNKKKTITFGRGLDHNKNNANDPNYSDLNLSTEEFIKSCLS